MTDAAEVFGRWMLGTGTDDLLETTLADRDRIFNHGYYTWVEQQGVSLADFERRRDQRFWYSLRDLLPAWDAMIEEFNGRTGARGEAMSPPSTICCAGCGYAADRTTPTRSGARGPGPTTPTT